MIGVRFLKQYADVIEEELAVLCSMKHCLPEMLNASRAPKLTQINMHWRQESC